AAAVRLESGGGPFRQAAALRLRAGIELARGDNEAAAMLAGQSFSIWQSADAAVVAARANLRAGASDRARNWLRRALEAGAARASARGIPTARSPTSPPAWPAPRAVPRPGTSRSSPPRATPTAPARRRPR